MKRQCVLGALVASGVLSIAVSAQNQAPSQAAIDATDIIAYTEGGKVFILHATKWPIKKPMSAAEFYRYIAEHAL